MIVPLFSCLCRDTGLERESQYKKKKIISLFDLVDKYHFLSEPKEYNYLGRVNSILPSDREGFEQLKVCTL